VSNLRASSERQESIVLVALELLAVGGPQAVTMKAVAEKTGLSRPAIYQYFSSSSHILAELVINEMADLTNALENLLGEVKDPLEKVRVWVHYSLVHLSTTDHALIQEISRQYLPDDQRGVIRALHGLLMGTIIEPLEALNIKDAPSVCGLIYGSVAAAAQRILEGSQFLTEARLLEDFLEAGLTRHISPSTAS
jgi:AcrR family transcriptional regulator